MKPRLLELRQAVLDKNDQLAHALRRQFKAAGVLAVESLGLAGSGKLVYFMSIDGVKFRRPVEPGVLLRLEGEFVQKRARICKFAGKAYLGDDLATECEFTAMIADPPESQAAR